MDTSATLNKAPLTDAEYEAIVDQHLAQLKLMQRKMDDDQREIEALRAETDATLADIMKTLQVRSAI